MTSSSRPRIMRTLARVVFALVFTAFALPRTAAAQIGTTTQIITGRVSGPDSLPLAGAHVDVTSRETGVVKHTLTHQDGRFSLLFRDGGASYTVKVTYIGMAPATVTLVRQADEDRLVAEVHMARTAVQLSAVQVKANARTGAPGASNAGGSGAALPQQLLERLPVNAGDLNAIASLAPGVIPTSATDSTPASFSVSGQPANQNNTTVDGSSFLFGSLPQDGVRAVRVVTNAYDVSRGQFTGGQISTTTKSGTSEVQGTATAIRQQPELQFPASTSPTFGQKYTQTTGSFGIGGPIKQDEMFYFTSLQYDRKSDALPSLLNASSGALANLGANPDSVRRFLQLAARDGISAAFAPSTRTASTTSALARIDWDFSDSHSLMLRGDYRHQTQDPSRISPLALPQTGGQLRSDGGGFMATLTSSLGDFINEARGYASQDHQSSSAFLSAPLGVVTVASNATAGTAGTAGSVASLQFGGNPSLPRSSTNQLLEFSDELSYLVGDHRLKLGALLNETRSTTGAVPNRLGTFLYNSLGDFDAGRPALFARTIGGSDQSAGANNMALYLGDAWRRSATLQFAYGLRAEMTTLPNPPAENPDVASKFGRSTHDWPTDMRITPRLGFTYLFWNTAGLPEGALQGGIGEFRGTVPSFLVGAARNGTGLPGAQSTLLCAGANTPTPDWAAYLSNPSSIPSTCNGSASAAAAAQPQVVLIDRDFGAPAVWRASLGLIHRIGDLYSVNTEALFAYGVSSPFANDLNLPAASFALAAEGGRPVYARPGDIAPATGSVGALTTRPAPELGSVLALGSGFKSRTGQLTATLNMPGFRSGLTSASYTFNRVLDQSNGYGLGAYLPTTAGNPNAVEWGTSDLERRHQFLLTSFMPFKHGFDFTAIGHLLSGPRYTPMVNGDINGDGSRNDRAFIAADGSAQAAAIQKLIASTDDRAADCIRSQLGRIAGRNSCTTPWTPTLDLQLNWAPRANIFDDRLTLSLVATNTLAGADRLLHGANVHGWGEPVIPDRTLLTVTGFDASARQYQYAVNSHFGTPIGTQSAFLSPFQIGLRAHVVLGTDPVRAQLKAVTQNANGAQASQSEIKDRLMRGVPYPVRTLLAEADSLGLDLTKEQRAKLTAINDAYAKQIDSIGTYVADVFTKAGPHPDLGALAPKLQPVNITILKILTQSVKDAQTTLTPQQWAKVPEKVRLPLSALQQQQQNSQQNRGRPPA